MDYLGTLARAIRDLYGCEARHLESVPVHETFRGASVWEGVVEVFALEGHASAARCYAWAYQKDAGSEVVAVLGVPPINTPVDAVRAAVARAARG